MVRTYRVIAAKKEKEIEDMINELAADGWEVDEFGYARARHYWALMVKETQ
jgi:hypothetical protein